MKYRDHRGGLDESMKTEIEVNNIGELKDHINNVWSVGMYMPVVEQIEFNDGMIINQRKVKRHQEKVRALVR